MILYGFAPIDLTPMETQNAKWWDCVWNNSFQYLAWGIHPITQCVTKYVESIQLQPCTNKYHCPHRRIHYSTGLTLVSAANQRWSSLLLHLALLQYFFGMEQHHINDSNSLFQSLKTPHAAFHFKVLKHSNCEMLLF